VCALRLLSRETPTPRMRENCSVLESRRMTWAVTPRLGAMQPMVSSLRDGIVRPGALYGQKRDSPASSVDRDDVVLTLRIEHAVEERQHLFLACQRLHSLLQGWGDASKADPR
jgi:hypothetical protein